MCPCHQCDAVWPAVLGEPHMLSSQRSSAVVSDDLCAHAEASSHCWLTHSHPGHASIPPNTNPPPPHTHTHVHEHKTGWLSDAQQSLSAKSGKRARVRGVCLMCVSCSLRSFCPWETAGVSWCNQNLYIVSPSSIWRRRTGSLCWVSMNNVQMLSSNKKALAAYSLICRFIQGVSGVQGPLFCKEECQQ